MITGRPQIGPDVAAGGAEAVIRRGGGLFGRGMTHALPVLGGERGLGKLRGVAGDGGVGG
jgi:hypothetical protein